MLPSIFEKYSSNLTESLLIVNYSNNIRKEKENFPSERRFIIWIHPSFYNVISLNKAPLKLFLISS